MDSRQKTPSKLVRLALGAALIYLAVLGFHYPAGVDAPLSPEEVEKNRKYYAEAYSQNPKGEDKPASDYEIRYIRIATRAAQEEKITEKVTAFAEAYGLRDKAVLEVGSGRGNLQDVVENYTGLDISSSVSRFYHKKFVLGSATSMPFSDSSFDGGWTIWVLEHVPNPEQALSEMRRVMRNGAVLYLFPAWNCDGWAAHGYRVRPYSDFGLGGKLVKATIPIRDTSLFRLLTFTPVRLIRDIASRTGPTKLHYHRREPNFDTYWEADADAINGIDRHEMMLWFRSRGDECLNCEGRNGTPLMSALPLIVKIKK